MILTTSDEINAFAGLSLRAQLRLMKLGMKNSRFSKRDLMHAVTMYHTGRTYRANDIDLAIADLTAKYRVIV